MKLLFTHAVADLRSIENLFHGKGGRAFKNGGGKHCPAIEVYRTARYFTITDESIGPADILRQVSIDDLAWLIRHAGPRFAHKDKAGTDQSRSGKAFRKGTKLKAKGFSYEQMRDALLADDNADVADWAHTKGLANGEREMRRVFDNADAPCVSGERFTDLGNARRLVGFFGADIRYVSHFNAWYIWEGHHWRRDENGAIMRFAKDAIEKLFAESAKIEDEMSRNAMRKFAL